MYGQQPQQPQQPAAPQGAGDVRALLKAGSALAEPKKNPERDGRPFVIVPEGFEVKTLPTLAVPERAAGTAKLRDAPSFIAYVNAHKNKATRVYATLEPAQFLAVFDDFAGNLGSVEAADWREWRAQFAVPLSREWQIWTKSHKANMTQLSFAEFLQDNLPDVVEPDGATLLEMSLNFEASQAGNFRANQRLQDGSHTLVWAAENNATGTVRLPEHIRLSIPVFENSDKRDMVARLKYRIRDGVLTIWYELVRPHKVLEQAFMDTWGAIKAATGVALLLGSPE